MKLDLTRDEWEALRDVVYQWIDEGFQVPPYDDALVAVFDKLDMDHYVPEYLRSINIVRPDVPRAEKPAGDRDERLMPRTD